MNLAIQACGKRGLGGANSGKPDVFKRRLAVCLFPCILFVVTVCFSVRICRAESTDSSESGVIPSAVLDAEKERVETIKRISKPTIAIFDSNGQGGGSGVLISADGFALTNFHVAAPTGPAMKVGLSDGRLLDAVIVGVDPGGDVALIKLLLPSDEKSSGANNRGATDRNFPVADIGDSDTVRVGDWTYVAGNPFLLADDFQPTITYGIISGVHRYQYPAGTLLGIRGLHSDRRGHQPRQFGWTAVRFRGQADRN